jgi:UMF1 family MFS transporter
MAGGVSVTPAGEAPAYGTRREQRAWYWYDWANSAFPTTVVTVFAGPFLTAAAEAAADASGFVHPLGIPVRAGAWYPYLVSISALFQVLLMPIVGAIADHSGRRKFLLAATTAVGATMTALLWFVTGPAYILGGILFLVASVAFSCAIVVYYSFLPDIASPAERDDVSSRGWAFGYLGGGLVLAANLALFLLAEGDAIPIDSGTAVRLGIVSAAVWWAGFTVVSLRGLNDRGEGARLSGGIVRAGFRQLGATFRGLRATPVTLLFLAAYLLYNDGIQTVISQSSVYADNELRLTQSVIIIAILLVQFVAMGGAWLAGRLARRSGAKRVIIGSLFIWMGVLGYAFFMPKEVPVTFYVLAALIGLVLGGTQALSRSLFSQMIPAGREAEYFSAYEIADKGTSWLGALIFGLALQFTGSYRIAIISLLILFGLGTVLLARTNVRTAITEAGNPQPPKV